MAMAWQIEILNETVAAEIKALPADIQAKFPRLGERIRMVGPGNSSRAAYQASGRQAVGDAIEWT
jgi:hypothetical protein